MGDDGKKPPFVIGIQSPYYWHPSDSPGPTITVIKFDGRNYELWEQAVQTALIAKNKLSFIDGIITEPTDKKYPEAQAWAMVNSMITSWIMNMIDLRLHTSFAYVKSTQILWENIRKRYLVSNVRKIHQQKSQIASLSKKNMK